MAIKASIVIRCHNEEKHIGRLLTGIMQQTFRDIEIIIVDSGSTDATISIASSYPIKLLRIQPEDFSFGRSLNYGCQEAIGDFIVITSAHTYPMYTDWLQQLLDPFNDPKIALVYGKQRGNKTTKFSEQQIFAKWFPERSNLHQLEPFCNNANAAIRRMLWQKFPYDETLTGLEDLDWAKRVLQEGYTVCYKAQAEIIHLHDETPERIYNRYRREAIALKRIYPEERFTRWDFIRLFITNSLNDYYHAWHDRVLVKNLLNILIFRFMQFLGTYKGFIQYGPVTSQLKQTFFYPKGRTRVNLPQHSTSVNRVQYTDYPTEQV